MLPFDREAMVRLVDETAIGDRETSDLTLSVCEKEQGGKVDTFSCPSI